MIDLAAIEKLTLPHRAGRLPEGTRPQPPRYLTVHYNGPAVAGAGSPDAERAQLVADAKFHIGKTWGFTEDLAGKAIPIKGFRIMYDYAVLSDGTALTLGDPLDYLYHCGNSTGNGRSLAVHVPVGGAQDVSDEQWSGVVALYAALALRYGWLGRDQLIGHCEWPRATGAPPVLARDHYRVQPGQSLCPGERIMSRLIAYRNGYDAPIRLSFRIRGDVPVARVRTAPTTDSLIAVWQKAPYTLHAGDEVIIDAIVTGAAVQGERRWAHLANQLGFVSWTLLQ